MSEWGEIQKAVSENSRRLGWQQDYKDPEIVVLYKSSKIALMHTELAEATEALRHGNPPSDHIPEFSGMEEEFADTVIRIMHFAEQFNLRIWEAVIAKADFNEQREYKHGGKAI